MKTEAEISYMKFTHAMAPRINTGKRLVADGSYIDNQNNRELFYQSTANSLTRQC